MNYEDIDSLLSSLQENNAALQSKVDEMSNIVNNFNYSPFDDSQLKAEISNVKTEISNVKAEVFDALKNFRIPQQEEQEEQEEKDRPKTFEELLGLDK